jgi:hypothetical protein
LEESSDALPCCGDGSLCGFSHEVLELCEHLLDRVEVGGVGRQERQVGASGFDGFADEAVVGFDRESLLERDEAWLNRNGIHVRLIF